MNSNQWTPFRTWSALLAVSFIASALPALEPQEMLRLAKKNMQDRTWKVEVAAHGDHAMKIAGLIHDNDFDLTVKTQVRETRQIAIGEKCWMSLDRGKTWKSYPAPDRRFFYLTHAPINYRGDEKIPPFEKIDREGDNIPGTVHIRLINEAPITYDGDRPNVWIKLKEDGTPDVLARSFGPLVFANDYVPADVHYTAADGEKIIAPPGNMAAVPAVNAADELLATALKLMEQGLWEVDCKAEFKKRIRMRGLLAKEDFDLNMDPKDGNDSPVHGMRVKGVVYGSLDGGKTWKYEPPTDIAIYNWVHSPLISKMVMPLFEEAGRFEENGETLVKLRLKVEENITNRDELPTYWVALGKDGQTTGVRRYRGLGIRADAPQDTMKFDISYRPASSDAAILPPPRELIVNAKATETAKKPASKTAGTKTLTRTVVVIVDGAKLKLDMPLSFTLDAKKDKSDKKTLATYSRKDGVWGTITRGTHGITTDGLQNYMDRRVAEYSEKLSKDLDADIHWIRHEIISRDGQTWVDMRYVPMLKGSKPQGPADYERNPLYTRFLSTSYKGQLLEILFTANLDTEPATKALLDQIIESAKLEEK